MTLKSTTYLSGSTWLWMLGLGWVWMCGCQADQLPRRRIPVPESPAALQRGFASTPRNDSSIQTPRTTGKTVNAGYPSSSSGPSVAGLRWTVPVRWRVGRARSMRIATYWIPSSANPRAEAGECSVFYFGQNQGGSLTANFERWKQQFRPDPGKAQLTLSLTKQFRVGTLNVATLELQGTYLSSIRPMDPQKIPKPDHEMFGVIVGAPQGMVFFKCVGARTLMQAAKHEFHTLVQSFRTR